MNTPVYIIGSGAIGKALAMLLESEGRKVKLLRGRSTEPAQSSRSTTLHLAGDIQLKEQVPVYTLEQFDKLEGTIIITTKSFGNTSLAAALRQKAGQADVVLLQNGLGVEQPFISAGFKSVMRCVLFVTSQVMDEYSIRFKPVRPSPIGMVHGSKERLTEVVAYLNTSAFPFCEEAHIQPVIWKKAIINCVFNSICPLLETDNGIFHREKEVLEMGIDIIREGLAVAELKGVKIKEEDVVEQLLQISRTSDGQLISTLQDMRANRPTEIETLNLAISNMGKELRRESMVQKNSLLGRLVWWKSQLHR